MKPLFITLLLLTGSLLVNAQGYPLSFNVEAGINLSDLRSNNPENTNPKIGLRTGVIAEYEFAQSFGLQSGILFSSKGTRLEQKGLSDLAINANYLQAPILIIYKINIMDGTQITINAGTYMAYGISGRSTYSVQGISNNQKWDMSSSTFGSDGFDFRRFDIGLEGGIGTEIDRFLIHLGYEHGLRNIASSKQMYSYKNHNAYMTIGYKF